MLTNILLVGCNYTGEEIPNTKIDTFGLCRPEICEEKAANALYEYDIIIINPASYSHFIFGEETEHSQSSTELWDLKHENNNYDLDTVYDYADREAELSGAISNGTKVIFLLANNKSVNFFGNRKSHIGYASRSVQKIIESATVRSKKKSHYRITSNSVEFKPYFEQLQVDGWQFCITGYDDKIKSFAHSLEGYCLGGRVEMDDAFAWILTPPTSQLATNILVQCAFNLGNSDVPKNKYHGIFLSHTSTDKPFVRDLKSRLEAHAVKDVWLDEAEIQIGDSLTKKIEEALKKTKYMGIVLSPRSIKSDWVEKELEIAINREISTREVVVLPLLYEKCDLPSFLLGKMYADFTSPSEYEESLSKLLRRLKV
jgi:hypothetical protein